MTSPEKKSPKKLSKKVSPWTKATDLRGQALVDFFDFETENASSQGGLAQYVSTEDAFKENLLQIQDETVYFKVDQTQQVQGLRKSIRVSSKTSFSPGSLLIIDVKHMPVACGAWPAIWTVAKDGTWPAKGEIDIVEGVNFFTHNSYSAHTKDGFVMHPHGFTSKFMLDADHKNNCGVDATDNQGCGLRDRRSDAFGEPFNSEGGGVFILDWADRAIWINFYPRNELPDHIRNGTPDPSSPWRRHPRAYFTDTSGQETGGYFQDHVLVINTNLCGKWPDGVWSEDTSYAGQNQTCAAITGADSCANYILNSGSQLGEAYWAINSIEVYNNATKPNPN